MKLGLSEALPCWPNTKAADQSAKAAYVLAASPLTVVMHHSAGAPASGRNLPLYAATQAAKQGRPFHDGRRDESASLLARLSPTRWL
jgi:hypothetical protein